MLKSKMVVQPLVMMVALGVAIGVAAVADRHVVSAAASLGKQWLMKMDTDSDGTVSKAEMMKYMDAEFDKVDKDHDGTLDAKELSQFRANLASGK